MFNYLYLLQDAIDLHTNIYKIGKTTKLPEKRLNGYNKNVVPYGFLSVDECSKRENELLEIFNKKFKLIRGREYFEGKLEDMINEFNSFCTQKDIINNILKNNEIIKENELINLYNKIKNKNEITTEYINEIQVQNKEIKIEEIESVNIFENNEDYNIKYYYLNNIYRCKLCTESFKTKFNLDRHMNKKNKCNIATPFQCIKCLKYFKYKKNLIEHQEKNICNNITNELINNENELALKIILTNNSLKNDEKLKCINKMNINITNEYFQLINKMDININQKIILIKNLAKNIN